MLLEKEELNNKLFETIRDWKNNEAELYKKEIEPHDAKSKLRSKNFELLERLDRLTLRSAFGKCKRACLRLNFYLEAHTSFPITHAPPIHRVYFSGRSLACFWSTPPGRLNVGKYF